MTKTHSIELVDLKGTVIAPKGYVDEFMALVHALPSGAKDLRDVYEFFERVSDEKLSIEGLPALSKIILQHLPYICKATEKDMDRYMVQLKTSLGFLEKGSHIVAMKVINYAVFPGFTGAFFRSGVSGGAGAAVGTVVPVVDSPRKGL